MRRAAWGVWGVARAAWFDTYHECVSCFVCLWLLCVCVRARVWCARRGRGRRGVQPRRLVACLMHYCAFYVFHFCLVWFCARVVCGCRRARARSVWADAAHARPRALVCAVRSVQEPRADVLPRRRCGDRGVRRDTRGARVFGECVSVFVRVFGECVSVFVRVFGECVGVFVRIARRRRMCLFGVRRAARGMPPAACAP